MIKICKNCGKAFELKSTRGGAKNREYCYSVACDLARKRENSRRYTQKQKKMKVELDGKEKKSSNTDLIKEMITKVDRKKVERILAGSYNIPLTSLTGLDKLLEQWAEAKQDMYLLFGKKLKIEKQIEFELGSREISNKLEELCNDYPVFMYILNHIDDKELEENKYMGSCTSLHALSNNIQRNMKITRFFSIAMNNEKFDIDISKIYENRKCKETICISIDPVDYLLMSINKSGWESCHKLHDMKANSAHSWGCYSAGTISYMVDTATLIAYKHSDKIYEYQINKCKIKEYSKNWRQVIYYDNNTHAFLTSREYPYSDENVANEVRKLLEDIINKGLGVDEKWIFVRNVGENYCCDITDLHYNDVLNDRENVFCRLDYVNKENVRFAIGGSPICPICGVNEIIVERHPMCEECYNDLL